MEPTEADTVEAAGYPPGRGVSGASYDPRLTNEDLAPLKEQTWKSYNIFAFWMSDVHSVGGYITMGTLFAVGLNAWQVFLCLIVGICIVQFFCNLVAKPSQQAGVAYPVISRASFGVRGANIPAIVRGCIAVAWYGVQTFLAAESLNIVFLKVVPGIAEPLASHDFLWLSLLGWISYAILWVLQAALFLRGMDMIRKFIDFAGPAVYIVMFVMCVYMLFKVDFNIDLNLSEKQLTGWALVWALTGAVATVVSYFSGPMLNFGDFSRYSESFGALKKGNFWGLPINFVVFSLLTVLTAAATLPLYGELITDPIVTVEKLDNTFAIVLGGFTFVVATIGINIVANFISPAFDFSNVSPQKISWTAGGMIAAVGSVILLPWVWYNNGTAIAFTLGILGGLIGPLFGILIADFYWIRRQKIVVDDLFTMEPDGEYWYTNGVNRAAVYALIAAGAVSISSALIPTIWDLFRDGDGTPISWISNYAWFIGCGLGFAVYIVIARKMNVAGSGERPLSLVRAEADTEVAVG
jgi:NCS1 family nucleobase:cation symporter-1